MVLSVMDAATFTLTPLQSASIRALVHRAEEILGPLTLKKQVELIFDNFDWIPSAKWAKKALALVNAPEPDVYL